MPKISIIIPVIRPELVERCIKAIKENAGYQDYEIVTDLDQNQIGCPKMVKQLVEKAQGDYVLFLGDDTIPQKDFLLEAVNMMSLFEDGIGLVALNDNSGRRTLATHWLASKQLLPLIGGEFFYTGYNHCFCDNELSLRCQLLDKYAYAEKSLIEHDNPILKGIKKYGPKAKIKADAHYVRAYSKQVLDKRIFLERKEEILKSYKFTGERLVPLAMEKSLTTEQHFNRYNWASQFTKGKKVIDAACGTGYGSELLLAKDYVGLDVVVSTIVYANELYSKENVHFGICDLNEEFLTKESDIVVSFETIEHLTYPERFLKNVQENCQLFIFSIPVNNKSDFHLNVWNSEEIKAIMESYFEVEWYSQNEKIEKGFKPAKFLLGLAKPK